MEQFNNETIGLNSKTFMQTFNPQSLKKLYIPPEDSHKGQNGKLLIIGGSKLFHAASLWALKVASRIVDMVFYSSVPENNAIVQKAKHEFRDGIVVPKDQLDSYIREADCVLIGPGMVRNSKFKIQSSKLSPFGRSPVGRQFKVQNLREIDKLKDEGEQTHYLTKYLLYKYKDKKWVIDAGSLQMMEREWLKWLNGNVIITPHQKEFERLFSLSLRGVRRLTDDAAIPEEIASPRQVGARNDIILEVAKKYNCTILLKGRVDIVCGLNKSVRPPTFKLRRVEGGNAGMTKGGTGDVLAGLVAALYCKNDAFLSACAGSYINKKAGDELYKRVGPYFNASDLADEIRRAMKNYIVDSK